MEDFTGGQENFFTVNPGDSIRVEFTFGGGETDIYYALHIESAQNAWFYNAYGMNALIPNTAINRPPFGGQYYPITSEQASSFANTIGGGKQNSVWIPLISRYV